VALPLPDQGLEMCRHAVDVMAGVFLVTEVMQRRGEKPIAHHQFYRIAGICRQVGETPGEVERGAELPVELPVGSRSPARPISRVSGRGTVFAGNAAGERAGSSADAAAPAHAIDANFGIGTLIRA
jgi:hypothetical protein